jgi:hypothetical protein
MNETERLRVELDTMRRTNEAYAEELRARDLEAAKDTTPQTNYLLQSAQQFVEQNLGDPKALEELRRAAWVDWSLSAAGNLYADRAPRDGSWPEGMTPESYVRKFHGLNEDGDALAGETPPEAEAIKLSPWLEAALAKAKEGKS